MSAIGMIVSIIESCLVRASLPLESYTKKGDAPPPHERWERADASDAPKARWQSHFYFAERYLAKADVISGLSQLAQAKNLKRSVSKADWKLIQALKNYRNCMFHGGFKWSLERHSRLGKLIEN
jgi:hypothetical protein